VAWHGPAWWKGIWRKTKKTTYNKQETPNMKNNKIAGIINPEMEKKAEDFEANWDLVNMIDNLCCDFIDEHDGIYAEDVYVALERVKWHFLQTHVETRIERRLEKAGIKLPELE